MFIKISDDKIINTDYIVSATLRGDAVVVIQLGDVGNQYNFDEGRSQPVKNLEFVKGEYATKVWRALEHFVEGRLKI
jgi:predicted phosphodiesterase